VTSAVAGSVVYQVIVAYALRLGIPATDLRLATAVLVVGVVALKATRKEQAYEELEA
jgi:putative ABC transport system permease protein